MNKKKVYLIGIKGVGMASLAVYLKEKGYEVSGSDSPEIFQTDSVLKKFHIEVFDGFKKTNLPEYIDLVIYSAAYTSKNEELTEAKLRGLKILSLGQALGLFMKGNTQVSIAGTHGKTTSAALAAWTLKKVGFDPSYFIGCAKVTGLIAPGHFGTDKVFIAEADEYVSDLQIDRKPKFLWQNPSYLLITNIDFDHPDVFADLSKVQDAFRSFIKNVTKDGFVFINKQEKNVVEITQNITKRVVTFGYDISSDFRITDESFNNKITSFEIDNKGNNYLIRLQIPGRHNVVNACGVFALLVTMGYSPKKIIPAFFAFKGTKRRIELINEKNDILYFDDYAHHPREIQATINALKTFYPYRRLICVFQPHTFTRTQFLFKEFSESFSRSDVNIIMEVFSSAREKKGVSDISGKKLADSISEKNNNKTYYARDLNSAAHIVNKIIKNNDILVTLGAGDVYKLHEQI